MKLQKFIKNKKQKGIVIGSIIGILVLIGGISLYRSFALYKVEKTFDVLEGTVPNFSNGDIQLAITVDGRKEENIPKENNNYGVVVSCDNAIGSWDYENWNAVLGDFNGSKIKCNLYFESTFSGYIKALSNVEESIVKEEHEATDQTPDLADYRYVGATPNNYVCLEESEKCTDDNLYRIIGVMPTQSSDGGSYEDRVKLIDMNYNVNQGWNENENNNWLDSQVYYYLNNDYWQSIQSYQHYIEDAKWYLGGLDSRNTASYFYRKERGNVGAYSAPQTINTISKIGLIYPSDYSYATNGGNITSRENCLKSITGDNPWGSTDNDCENNDWLHINEQVYWTLIGSGVHSKTEALVVHGIGFLSWADIKTSSSYQIYIKPTFYLKSNIQYKSGNGSKENPYLISIKNS